jgi:hypothetical protein
VRRVLNAFFTGALFVVICVVFSGIFTGLVFSIIEQSDECFEDRTSLSNYRINEALSLVDLKRIKRRFR